MSTTFDWNELNRPRWSSLSDFAGSGEEIEDNLYTLIPCVYAIANPSFGSADDPGVGAILWATCLGVARSVHARDKPLSESGDRCAIPPPSVLGFESLTFAAVLAYETNREGSPPQVSATYRFGDGEFLSSEVRSVNREYYFASANPEDDDEALAISFALPQR